MPTQPPPQSTNAQALELAGQALHVAGVTIATTIDGNNAVAREQLSQDAATRRIAILNDVLRIQATDPVAAENLRLQADALQLVIDSLKTHLRRTRLFTCQLELASWHSAGLCGFCRRKLALKPDERKGSSNRSSCRHWRDHPAATAPILCDNVVAPRDDAPRITPPISRALTAAPSSIPASVSARAAMDGEYCSADRSG